VWSIRAALVSSTQHHQPLLPTLLSHGYTFIGKATVPKLVRELDREALAYTERQVPLQGREVPVFLGVVNLESRPYYYDLRVTLVKMICLSWAGVELAEWKEGGGEAEWVEWRRKMVVCKATRAVKRLHQEGVAHQGCCGEKCDVV
jgi:hypothetical protein